MSRQNAAAAQMAPASTPHTMETVRIEALANLPVSESGTRRKMTAASIAAGLNSVGHDDVYDVSIPASPRVPSIVNRTRATRAGRWNGDVLAQWVKLQAEEDQG